MDLQTVHGLRLFTIEQRDYRPSVFVIHTDNVLVRDHDMLYLPALDVEGEKLLDLLLHVSIGAVLEDI